MHAASPSVSHDEGVQNQSFVNGLGRRIAAGAGAGIVTLLGILVSLYWIYCLVVTWIGHGNWGTPLFQTTAAAALVIGVAGFARKTLAWIPLLVIAAAWCVVSGLPLLPVAQVILQAALVTLMIAAAVAAVSAAQQAEKPRF